MGLEIFGIILQMIFALALVLLLIAIVYKLSNNKLKMVNKRKYMTVLERLQISKDTSLCVVKIGSKGHVISTSPGKNEIIQTLTEEEIKEIEDRKKREYEDTMLAYENMVNKGVDMMSNVKKRFKLEEQKDEK